jgi:hypothetical protein
VKQLLWVVGRMIGGMCVGCDVCDSWQGVVDIVYCVLCGER